MDDNGGGDEIEPKPGKKEACGDASVAQHFSDSFGHGLHLQNQQLPNAVVWDSWLHLYKNNVFCWFRLSSLWTRG